MNAPLPNFPLQYSQPDLSIYHQNVIGANVQGTDFVEGFPTTNTGTSLGMYQHLGIDGQGNKKTDFLNVSGTSTGGYNFWTSNSTDAPILLADITIDGISIAASGISSQISNTAIKSQNATTNLLSQLTPDGISVRDLANSIGTLVANNRVLVNSDITGYGGTLTDSYLTINNGANISQLTATDLTFNSVSLKSSVSTNTSNIATNTSNIATNTSNITTLTIKQISTINQYISAAIYADGRPPQAPSTTIAQQYAYTPSWYFQNTTAGYKINWYIGATPGMLVSDILGLYVSFFNGNNTSNDNTPFITVYTTPTGSSDYAPGFYHSACTYIFDGSISANSRYTEFLNLNSCPSPNYYGTTLRNMIQSPVAPNPRGAYLPTESVAFFSISSNSAAAVNTIEFAVSKFGIMTASGTTEVNFFA